MAPSKARKGDSSAVSKTATPPAKAAAKAVVSDSSVSSKPVKDGPKSASKKSVVSKKDALAVDAKLDGENVVVTDSVDSQESQLTDSFNEFMAKLQNIASQMGALKAEFRVLEKKAVREIKAAAKINAKRKRKSSNRAPSGFVKPTLISDELANFLKKPLGSEMARTEVTREINTYIRAHSLQDKSNGRKINPDNDLAKLLKIEDGQELTYFNLQKFMSPHFAKAGAFAALAAQAA